MSDRIKVGFQIKADGLHVRVWSTEDGEFDIAMNQEPFYSLTKSDTSRARGASAKAMGVSWPVHELKMDRERFRRLKAQADRDAAREKT